MTTTIFLHGSGTGGAEGWPVQAAAAEPTWQFMSRHPDGDLAERDAGRLIGLLADSGCAGNVVASSYGGNAAVLALQRRPDLVAALVLAEPATFDLARGAAAVEEHIVAMEPAALAAHDPAVSDREWSDLFAAGFGREPVTGGSRPLFEQTAEALERLGATRLVLPGAAHRVQDDPAFNVAVTTFLAEVPAD